MPCGMFSRCVPTQTVPLEESVPGNPGGPAAQSGCARHAGAAVLLQAAAHPRYEAGPELGFLPSDTV